MGFTLLKGCKFSVDWKEARSNFYKSLNAIISKLGTSPQSVDIILKLFVTNCLPCLTYAFAAAPAEGKEFEKLAFAYNSIFYKLFGVKTKKEIAFAQLHCGFLDFSNLQNFHRLSFLSKLVKAGSINKGTRLDETDWCDYERLMNSYNINLSSYGSNIKFCVYSYTELYLVTIC